MSMTDAAGQKTAAVASFAGGTFITGLGTYFEMLGPIIGPIASSVALVLASVLTYGRIKKGRLERELLHIEIREHREREAEKKREAADRAESGEPVRRKDD